ncbi:MAG: hotdog domain-containing protein [Planctomycetota bacterium]
MRHRENPAVRVVLMPRDTNSHGTIFGGVILSYLDIAGAIVARRYANHAYVTVAMDRVEFHEPVFVGDIVSVYGEVTRTGRTSVAVHLEVEAERALSPGVVVKVTEADVVYVAVNTKREPVPLVPQPPSPSPPAAPSYPPASPPKS